MAEDGTPQENTDKPKFGRRVRRETPGEPTKSAPAAKAPKAPKPDADKAASEAPKKARVRIGPKSRRPEAAAVEASPAPIVAPPPPQPLPQQPTKSVEPRHERHERKERDHREQRHRGPHAGQQPQQQPRPQRPPQDGQQLGMNLTDQASGGIRRKRRRRKGRRPDEGQGRGPSQAQAQPQSTESVVPVSVRTNDLPSAYVPGMVLPPVMDDLDEVPSGIFETDDLTDSDVDSDADSDSDDDSSASDSDGSRSDDGQNSVTDSYVDPSTLSGASSHPDSRSGRDRKRRKKRRERHEPPPVDRNSGYWWAEQWVRSFEMLFPSNASRARLAKGRTYARRGQVLELEVGPNGVLARVQGSRPRPYQVRLELNRLRRETWGRILHQLVGKATFLAQLLEGHLPPEIEEVFFSAGARLFPHGDVDVRARCNCPDPVSPCKHVAALNYSLADALQRDPFLLFAMRGKSRDQFLQDLREMRGRDRNNAPPPPSDEDLTEFWRMGRLAESVLKPTGWSMGNDPARLLQSLGEPQLEGIREGLFLPMLEATYRQVAESMRRLPKDA